jgi:hypothetical protein
MWFKGDNAEESISLLRTLIGDHQRYLLSYHDPSMLFTVSHLMSQNPSLKPMIPEESLAQDWEHDNECFGPWPRHKSPSHSK